MRRAAAVLTAGGIAILYAVMSVPAHSVEAGSAANRTGAVLFAATGCAHCHGTGGVGGGIGPDLQGIRTRRTAAAMKQQIQGGGQAMPAFGDQLSNQQIEDVVAYLRAKRPLVKVPAKATEAPPMPPASKDPD